ncbi:hypothetical protein [Tessaracoccus flavescens]|uniref:Uncharacterized protein n=1 Tax=Tessaracoccus flavescens TaxID=399497 RepID=A0A1Q2CW00_9ACTN|nr:hypothetical protein [Tessaracoccus flavescens]AQP50293.1 hypothetical protein BW733_05035 [Tessaracoccus flavescens]
MRPRDDDARPHTYGRADQREPDADTLSYAYADAAGDDSERPCHQRGPGAFGLAEPRRSESGRQPDSDAVARGSQRTGLDTTDLRVGRVAGHRVGGLVRRPGGRPRRRSRELPHLRRRGDERPRRGRLHHHQRQRDERSPVRVRAR